MHILNTPTQISQPDLDDNMIDFHSGMVRPPPCCLHKEAGEMSDLCRRCRCPHLRQNHDDHIYQARPRVLQHDVGLAQVETLPYHQPHLAQLEGPLDCCLC